MCRQGFPNHSPPEIWSCHVQGICVPSLDVVICRQDAARPVFVKALFASGPNRGPAASTRSHVSRVEAGCPRRHRQSQGPGGRQAYRRAKLSNLGAVRQRSSCQLAPCQPSQPLGNRGHPPFVGGGGTEAWPSRPIVHTACHATWHGQALRGGRQQRARTKVGRAVGRPAGPLPMPPPRSPSQIAPASRPRPARRVRGSWSSRRPRQPRSAGRQTSGRA